MEKLKIEGILLGLKLCKEMFAQGQLTHEAIRENEIYYQEELDRLTSEDKVIIETGERGKWFGYSISNPAICVQADSKEECERELDISIKIYTDYMKDHDNE